MVHCVERQGVSRSALEHAASGLSGALEEEETRAHSSLPSTRGGRAAEFRPTTDCSRFSLD